MLRATGHARMVSPIDTNVRLRNKISKKQAYHLFFIHSRSYMYYIIDYISISSFTFERNFDPIHDSFIFNIHM